MWQALREQTLGVQAALARFVLGLFVAALLLGVLRWATAPSAPSAPSAKDAAETADSSVPRT